MDQTIFFIVMPGFFKAIKQLNIVVFLSWGLVGEVR